RRGMERAWAGQGWVEPVVTWPDGTVAPADLMFRMPSGTPIWDRTLGEWLTQLCEAAGVDRLTPHGLRHAAVTLLEDTGAHPAVVQQLAGHASASMTDHYTAALQRAMREAVEMLAVRLREDPGRGR
ncbi:MAG: tyrosine-type recombinase/integrase, partial [Egibacteraceae bacterium]